MARNATYTIKEAAALAGLSERMIRNEIGRRVIRVERRPRGRADAIALPKGDVLYFRLVKDLHVRLSRNDRSALYRLLSGKARSAGEWRLERNSLRRGILVLDTKTVSNELESSLRSYDAGREKVTSHPEVLGGEPVFVGTRIMIRHIGKLALRGVPSAEIRTDYPALSDDDIAFAAMFSRMKPGPGRPGKLRFRREAA